MKKLVIFDFDGTLVDTITDVGICFNQALRISGFPEHPLNKFDTFAGGNLETVVSKMLPKESITVENIDKVKNIYRELYLNSEKPNSKPYPGIMELLNDIKESGIKIAINSNKGQVLLDDMVNSIFTKDYFDSVIGYLESRPSKPDPYGVDLICRECNLQRRDAIYVGDGKSDIMTANNAGIPCCFVKWGQGSKEDWENIGISYRAENINQLKDILMGRHEYD